jgi:ABC-2 type transport system permease protein
MSILYITLKDLRLIARDRLALMFMLLVPIVVVTIVAVTLGSTNGGTITLPVVNEDEGPVAEVLIQMLGKHAEILEVDRSRAEAMVGKENAAAAALVLPGRMSKDYLANRPTTLTLLTDPAKGAELDTVKAYFLLADREASALADPLFEELLVLEEQSLTSSRLSTSSFEQTVPGFSIMFVLMGVLFGTAFAMRDEHDWGAYTRIRAAPIPGYAFLGGKLLARFLVGVVQMLVLFVFGHFAFNISLGQSVPTFLLMTAAVVFGMTGFSLVVAAFTGTREQVIPLGLTVVMIVCAIGGCWWPLFMEPEWLQRIAHVTVTAWAMDGMYDLVLRERTFVEVLPVLGTLFAYGAVCLIMGAWLNRTAD